MFIFHFEIFTREIYIVLMIHCITVEEMVSNIIVKLIDGYRKKVFREPVEEKVKGYTISVDKKTGLPYFKEK